MENQKFKVYQLQMVDTIVKEDDSNNDRLGYSSSAISYNLKLNEIAEYIIQNPLDDYDSIKDEIWDACNVTCWDNSYKEGSNIVRSNTITIPTKDFKGYCNSDIIVETPTGLYKCDTIGWTKVNDINEGIYRIIIQYIPIRWESVRNKSDFSLDKLKEMKQIIEQEVEDEAKYKE